MMSLRGSGSETWNGAPDVTRVTSSGREFSSIHSEKLRSVARDMSDLSQRKTVTSSRVLETAEESVKPRPCLTEGVCFAGDRRRVDYVLVYHCKTQLSLIANGNLSTGRPAPFSPNMQTDQEGAGLEAGVASGPGEEEHALIREEFERRLQEQGVEIERDLEMKTVCFTRLHVPWSVLSREAELLKISVSTKTVYELKKKTGFVGVLNLIWDKINKPFQPGVSTTQQLPHTRVLTLPFHRGKLHLLDISSPATLFNTATRGRIVCEILRRTACSHSCHTLGIKPLLAKGVYNAAFPLHDGDFNSDGKELHNDRQLLHDEWANYKVFFKYQPIDLIRRYFGEKIGLYFSWLGFYTQLLIPASAMGIVVFMYGWMTVDTNVPSQEMCDKSLNFTMCPLCDGVCDYWQLSSMCSTARASYLFDNHATVAYTIFMSLWAVFLEHWKRRQRCLQHNWNLIDVEVEEDELRPSYGDSLLQKQQRKSKNTKKDELDEMTHDISEKKQIFSKGEQTMFGSESLTWTDRLPGYCINVSSILLMVVVTLAAVSGVILYRIIVFAIMSMTPDHETKANVRVTVTTTAVIINLLVVLFLDEIYGSVAAWLTELEIPKTEAAFEEHLIMKTFLLKSMNAFAPVFYVAFFKGRFAGRPGDYVYVFKDFRMEECAPAGCLIEVCIQLGMIMLGKQLIQNNVFEIAIPKLKKMYRNYKEQKDGSENKKGKDENVLRSRWESDYQLEPYEGLNPEYMEMIIQFGFVTLFVASFPLAPVFALLNNIIEIRLDAAKFVTEIRRPDAVRAKDIGIWYDILSGISKFAVITNAFVISFTSEFIPRMVYQYLYSETGTMHGFIDHTLAYFNTSNFKPGTAPNSTRLDRELRICRYKDYRDPPWSPESYQLSKQYWSVLAARLAFVIFFQNLAMFLSMLVAWLIPDVPCSLKDCLKREKALLLDLHLSEELEKQHRQSQCPAKMNNLEESIEMVPECSIKLQSQTTECKLQTADEENLPEEEPQSTTTKPINTAKDVHSLITEDPHLSQSVLQTPVTLEGSSLYHEFNLNRPSALNSRTRIHCQTLPARYKKDSPGKRSGRTSHSNSFVHFNQNFPQANSGTLQGNLTAPSPPPSETQSSKTSKLSCHPFQTELRSEELSCLQSEQEGPSSQVLAQTTSKPEISFSSLTALTRPPSRPELSVSPSAVLPRPPSKPQLMESIAKELQNPATRSSGRCQTLPSRCRGHASVESSLRSIHSTSFSKDKQKSYPTSSDVAHNTSV